MAKLIYSGITSLDGYVADENGNFDWGEPDEEVHTFINDLERGIGTYLYGRRMYEVMMGWETMEIERQPRHIRDFARIWQTADKVVYSRMLETVSTKQTRIERKFDSDAIRKMKAAAAQDLSVGGPELAAHAFREGLIDEFHLFLVPVAVGGGKRSLPSNLRLSLELLDETRFRSGFVHLRYLIA